MAWSDQQVIRDIISVLATQGWEKQLEEVVKFLKPFVNSSATEVSHMPGHVISHMPGHVIVQ